MKPTSSSPSTSSRKNPTSPTMNAPFATNCLLAQSAAPTAASPSACAASQTKRKCKMSAPSDAATTSKSKSSRTSSLSFAAPTPPTAQNQFAQSGSSMSMICCARIYPKPTRNSKCTFDNTSV